jgi:hypothetical protein
MLSDNLHLKHSCSGFAVAALVVPPVDSSAESG